MAVINHIGCAVRRIAALGASIGAAAALSFATAPSAAADITVPVNWTIIGIYPRSAPSMDAPKVGTAVPDGGRVSLACEAVGQPVSNGYQTIAIWDRLDDGTWLPNAFLDTRTDSWTPGVPRCDAAPASAPILDRPIRYEGDHLTNMYGPWPLAYALYDHYMWGQGRNVVLEPEWVAGISGFRAEVYSLDIGQLGVWTPPKDSDLFWAIGSFTVVRETPNCWAIYDHYDFTPDKPSNWPYVVYWSYQIGGAREFDVNASGCF